MHFKGLDHRMYGTIQKQVHQVLFIHRNNTMPTRVGRILMASQYDLGNICDFSALTKAVLDVACIQQGIIKKHATMINIIVLTQEGEENLKVVWRLSGDCVVCLNPKYKGKYNNHFLYKYPHTADNEKKEILAATQKK